MFDIEDIKYSVNDLKRNISLPLNPSCKLAEFLGILTGDGYMNFYKNKNSYIVEIAGDSRYDKIYLINYVKTLIFNLFHLTPRAIFQKGRHAIYLRLESKGLVEYLLRIGFVLGKKNQITVPLWIKENDDLMRYFVKGLADTDFSFHLRKSYPIISFTSKSKPMMQEVFTYLNNNGFEIKKFYKETKVDKRGYNDSTYYRLFLNGQKKNQLWTRLIGFRNNRYIKKKWGRGNLNPGYSAPRSVTS